MTSFCIVQGKSNATGKYGFFDTKLNIFDVILIYGIEMVKPMFNTATFKPAAHYANKYL